MFVSDPALAAAFDAVFFSIFGGRPDEDFEPDDAPRRLVAERAAAIRAGATGRPAGFERNLRSSTDGDRDEDGDTPEVEVPVAMATDEELLGRKRFDALEPHELAQLKPADDAAWSSRRARRTLGATKGRHGERVDLRRTLRRSLRTGGDPIRLARRRRRVVRRRLVPALRHLRLDGGRMRALTSSS